MFCGKCGCKIEAGSTHCARCGAKLDSSDLCGGFWGLVGDDPESGKQKAENVNASKEIAASQQPKERNTGTAMNSASAASPGERKKDASLRSPAGSSGKAPKAQKSKKWPTLVLIVLVLEIVQLFGMFFMGMQIRELKKNVSKTTSQSGIVNEKKLNTENEDVIGTEETAAEATSPAATEETEPFVQESQSSEGTGDSNSAKTESKSQKPGENGLPAEFTNADQGNDSRTSDEGSNAISNRNDDIRLNTEE